MADPSSWELIDVFDLDGQYVYQMEIEIQGYNELIDSLKIIGLNDLFTLYCRHHRRNYNNYLSLGVHFGILDHSGNQWALSMDHDENFHYNLLINDTLFLSYQKSNIAFYHDEGAPYFAATYREYAVKRKN